MREDTGYLYFFNKGATENFKITEGAYYLYLFYKGWTANFKIIEDAYYLYCFTKEQRWTLWSQQMRIIFFFITKEQRGLYDHRRRASSMFFHCLTKKHKKPTALKITHNEEHLYLYESIAVPNTVFITMTESIIDILTLRESRF